MREATRSQISSGDERTHRILGAAIEVHRTLGPGLMESAYESCLCAELAARGLAFRRQMPVRIRYKDEIIDIGYRIDLLVQDVVVELKAVARVLPIHRAQLLTYMKLARKSIGLLINFNELRLIDGVVRMAQTVRRPRPT